MLFSIIQAAAWRIQAANAQPSRILADLVNQVYDMGLNQAMETSGHFDLKRLKPTLDKIDVLWI